MCIWRLGCMYLLSLNPVYLCRNYKHMQEVNMSLNKDSTLDMTNAYVPLYRSRSNFRRLKLSRMSQIRDFHVFIFAGPHPVPLFFLFKLTSDRLE